MGYEYDFVFDWMVKKQQPGGSVAGQISSQPDEEKKEEPVAEDEMQN